jgi:alkanesulfonate monooxygenase SsuD/methylene tetrahydromethanopterin reductase-like flavin-dependent oxidoreductase (luciferase family)
MRLTMDALVEKARSAEGAGFTGMAGMDHLAPPLAEDHGMYEVLSTNAWLLARTERLVQAPLVLCDAFRHPAVLARQVVTLDHASSGRFELGLGWGSVPEELSTFGVRPTAPADRVQRMGETIEILRALWSGEEVDYDGRWFQLSGARQLPPPLGHIPLVLGGTGRRTLELVAAHADWWNVPVHQLHRLDEMRGHAGDARVSVQQLCAFVPEGVDRDALEGPARRRFGHNPNLLVGTRAEVIDHLSAMREHGVERFYMWFADFASTSTLEAFGDEVIDAFA